MVKLSHMSEFKCYNLLERIQLGNTIQNKRADYKNHPNFSINYKYEKFHRNINLKVTKEQHKKKLEQVKEMTKYFTLNNMEF